MNETHRKHPCCRPAVIAAACLITILLAGCGAEQQNSMAAADTTAPTVEQTAAPTPVPTPVPTPEPTPFSIVWMSDTQTMSKSERLSAAIQPMFDWVVQNREAESIQLVVHTGDIVENGWNDTYWSRISPAIDSLGDIPFVPAAGNHDVAKKRGGYEPLQKQGFIQRQDPDCQYKDGAGYYVRFSAGGMDVLVLALGYLSIDEDGFAWARSVFDANPDCYGILAVHSYLSYMGPRTSTLTPRGQRCRDGIVAQCKNVRLVLCGHVKEDARYEETFDDDGDGVAERLVTALRHNDQSAKRLTRIGYLRLLTFDPLARRITVTDYSPFLGKGRTNAYGTPVPPVVIENAF